MRAEWHDFSKGLWSVGGKEHTMTGYIRRAKGLHAIRTPHLRSRDGSTKLYDLTAHSLFRFDDVQIQAAGGSLYRAGAVVTSSLNGSRLRFVAMPAQPGLNDSLFITGGGLAIKMDDGGSVTAWGVTNPGGPPSLAETSAGTGALTNGIYIQSRIQEWHHRLALQRPRPRRPHHDRERPQQRLPHQHPCL